MMMLTLLLAQTAAASGAATSAAPEHAAWQWPLLWAGALISLLGAAIFSGAEIGMYSISKVRLRLRTARHERNALLLRDWLKRPTRALEGLLILQNIAGFAFTAAVTAMLARYGLNETPRTLISIAVVTPVILLFADIMPKDLFHTHADRWMFPLVPLLKGLFRVMTVIPLLPIVSVLSKVSTWLVGAGKNAPAAAGPRMEILMLFEESAATGVLTGTQQDLVQRALRLARISVREVMMPWNRVIGAPAGISREGFRALVRHYNVSRLPVLGNSTTEVLGIVDVLDALLPPPAGEPRPFKLTDYIHPPMTLIGEQPVRSAITLMQRARQTIGIVVDRHNRAIGLVTMKDLIEELVGDLENW